MWSEEAMEKALHATSEGMSVREAATQFGVPKSTMYGRISGRVQPGAAPGAPHYLDNEEEEEVVRWLEGCASIGCAKNVREVRSIVGAIVAAKNNLENVVVSHGWWDRFRARHLTLRTGESLAHHRAVSTNRVGISICLKKCLCQTISLQGPISYSMLIRLASLFNIALERG
jgi:transposase